MLHSRPEDGVNQTAVSMLVFEKEVMFPEDNSIWLVICLSGKDLEAHIDAIETLLNYF